ncbi:MAG TPA: SMC family ATPase [Streptosporangiaceae bacterium]|jgi:exonuclease SbcC
MRPLRLLLDGFGSYRQPAEADFTDVDFFALVGPTGSGKSTLIDGLCFALYGTVPRWGKQNAISDALAPAANACRVCLVFEVSGHRYAAVRALNRDKQGKVHTKEARLEQLDPAVAPDAPLAALLESPVEHIAEGPDHVTAGVEELLGLSYQHFTQSVLLPQGKFAEFLQVPATKRQDLLVKLLAFGVYEKVGQRARSRAQVAAERQRGAERERADLAAASPEAEAAAADRLAGLTSLEGAVDKALAALTQLKEEAAQSAAAAKASQEEARLLAAVRTPAEVSGLADRIIAADDLRSVRGQRMSRALDAERDAATAREALPDKGAMDLHRVAYAERRGLAGEVTRLEGELGAASVAEGTAVAALSSAEDALEAAQAAAEQSQLAHRAISVAQSLVVGEDCPVCLQPVAELPHHPAPADLAAARAAVEDAKKQRKRAADAAGLAARSVAGATSSLAAATAALDRNAAALAGAPAEDEVAAMLAAIEVAEEAFRQARRDAAGCRASLEEAERGRASLDEEERQAWARLRGARDSVVALGAPAVEAGDLTAGWAALTAWAGAAGAERAARQPELDVGAAALRKRLALETAELTALLAAHGVDGDPARAAANVATARARAEHELSAVRDALKKVARLDQVIASCREEEQVADLLGKLLRANSFERWLCTEALDSLVSEASDTLMELSGGQYRLQRDERNELFVIDYQDAGASRPVHTLSGGETFQASLALALALSRQVVELSAGKRDLNSVFLDEGFGTLDEDTLETVGATLERLADDSGRMVGIITHVAALAQRVPVRFVVSRTGTGSTLSRENAG